MKPLPLEPTAGSRLAMPWAALLAAAAGALAVLAFPPFGLSLVLVVSLAVLHGLLVGRRTGEGFLVGWSFGIGLLGFGIFWIRVSLNEFGNMGVWLAHGLTLIFILAMALYYGLLGALTAWLTGRLPGGPGGRLAGWVSPLLIFPALWVLLEWLRGWFLTGFPWLNAGDSQVEGPLAGYVPLLGVHGVSLLVALSAGLLWRLVAGRVLGAHRGLAPNSGPAPSPGRARERWGLAGALVLIWLAGLGLGRLEWTQAMGEPFRAAVLQANIPQSL